MWSKGVDQGLTTAPVQGIHEYRTATQGPAYPLGTKFWYGDRCYKYAKAGGTLIVHRAVAAGPYGISSWKVVGTETPAGSDQIYATIGTGEGGGGDGKVDKDELVGGYVVVFRLQAGADNTDYCFRIEANTVVATNGGTTILTIDQPLPFTCSTSAYTEITGNPYFEVKHITSGNRMFMGQPMYPATTTNCYLWLQTFGPTWLNPETGAGSDVFGNVNGGNQAVFEQNGSVVMHSAEDAAAGPLMKQHAGCVMNRVAGGANTQGTPLFFLQVSC